MRRKQPSRKARPVFAIMGDGECESWYFQMMKRNERDLSVQLKPSIPKKKKLKEQYEEVVVLAEDHTRVFWIVDLDVIVKENRTASKGKETPMQEFKRYYKALEGMDNVTVII